MSTLDEKIVRMSLDNKDFTSKVKSTIDSFGSLNSGMGKLNNVSLNGAVKSVNSIGEAARNTKLDTLIEAADAAKNRFTTMGIVAVTALSNITNRAVDAGMNLARSFTVTPIADGLQMYENKLKAIQVILSNTQGQSTLSDVTKSLGVLNDYAGKTVYSFEDMTTNMGTFTAAGVDLKTSQVAIQGIGNLAAASGSSTQQAATAMYQLSQAISSGKVGLQDWNSVVNAGMGGKKFQTALQDNAKAMGKNLDTSVSFRDSLQDGWLTTDVLMKTLQQFAEDKSMLKAATQSKTFGDAMDTINDQLKTGWSDTWELIMGDFKTAPKMWTAFANTIGDIVGGMADNRNKILGDFKKLGGMTTIIESIKTSFASGVVVVNLLKNAFHEVFPPATGKSLNELAEGFQKLTIFINSGLLNNSTALSHIFVGLFSAMHIGVTAVINVGKALIGLIPKGSGGTILEYVAAFADMITAFDKTGVSSIQLGKKMKLLMDVLKSLWNTISDLGHIASTALNGLTYALGTIWEAAAPGLKSLVDWIGKLVKSLDFNDVLTAGGLVGLLNIFKKVGNIGDAIDNVADAMTGLFKTSGKASEAFEQFGKALGAITTTVNAGTLMKIAASVVAMAFAMQLVANLSFGEIAKGLEVLGIALTMLVFAINKVNGINILQAWGASSIIKSVALALLEMSAALVILASIDPKYMGDALMGMAASLAILVLAMQVINKIAPKVTGSSFAMVLMASSIVILASALKILDTMNPDDVITGLAAMAAMFAEVGMFVVIVNKSHLDPGTAAGIFIVATALVIMDGAIALMGMLPLDVMVQGLGGIAVALTEIALFAKAIQGKSTLEASASMVIMAAALTMLVVPISALGVLPFDIVLKGLAAIGLVLVEIDLALKGAQNGLAGALSITAVAIAINLLVPPLAALAAIPVMGLCTALAALAAVFIIVAIAANAIGVTGAVGLLGFAVAIGALAIAIAGIGLVFTGFAAAVVALGAMTTAGVMVVIANFHQLLVGLQKDIPLIISIVADAVVGMAVAIGAAAPQIATAGLQLILGLLVAIRDNIYQIAMAAAEIIVNFCNALTDSLPMMIEAGANLMISFMNGLADTIRKNNQAIIDAVFNIIESILEVLVDALAKIIDVLFGWIPGVSGATKGIGGAAKDALRDAFDVKPVGEAKGKEFADGVASKSGDANTAGNTLGTSAKKGSGIQNLRDKGNNAGQSFANGIGDKNGTANGAGNILGTNAKDGSTTSLQGKGSEAGKTFSSGILDTKGSAQSGGESIASSGKSGAGSVSFHSAGSNAGQGFANGISSAWKSATSAASNLGSQAYSALKRALDIHSPSRKMAELGNYSGLGFAKGLDGTVGGIVDSANNMASKAVDAIAGAAPSIQAAMDTSLDLNPTITPVVDMNSAKVNDLSGLINGTATVDIKPVKVDWTDLFSFLEFILGGDDNGKSDNSTGSGDDIDINLTTYGSLDEVTARQWAGPIAQALEAARSRRVNNKGG